MKYLIGMMLITFNLYATPLKTVGVFVSFSMPNQLLYETLKECADEHIPVYLNGFIDNSMDKTLKAVVRLTTRIPHLNILIDPTKFEDFSIKNVPAIVVSSSNGFDVIYGNLSVRDGLLRMTSENNSGFSVGDYKEIFHA